jgi:hypothetical protein
MTVIRQTQKTLARHVSTTPVSTRAAGDISSVFPSLSGRLPEPLPPRFQALKKQLVKGKEEALSASWIRLLASLREEIEKIKTLGSDVSAIAFKYSNTKVEMLTPLPARSSRRLSSPM